MCNSHKHHRVYKVGLCTTEHWILVHSTLGVLGWPISRGIIGRVRLLIASLWLVIALVVGPFVSSFPSLIVGGMLVGTILLCKNLSQ